MSRKFPEIASSVKCEEWSGRRGCKSTRRKRILRPECQNFDRSIRKILHSEKSGSQESRLLDWQGRETTFVRGKELSQSPMESTFESFGDEDFDVKKWVNAQVLSSHSLAVASGNAKGTRCVCFAGDHGVRIRGTKGWANTIRDVCDALGTIWDQARVLPDTKLHGVSATP